MGRSPTSWSGKEGHDGRSPQLRSVRAPRHLEGVVRPRPRCLTCGKLVVFYRLLIRPERDRTSQRQRRYWLCERHGGDVLARLPRLDEHGIETVDEESA